MSLLWHIITNKDALGEWGCHALVFCTKYCQEGSWDSAIGMALEGHFKAHLWHLVS